MNPSGSNVHQILFISCHLYSHCLPNFLFWLLTYTPLFHAWHSSRFSIPCKADQSKWVNQLHRSGLNRCWILLWFWKPNHCFNIFLFNTEWTKDCKRGLQLDQQMTIPSESVIYSTYFKFSMQLLHVCNLLCIACNTTFPILCTKKLSQNTPK